MKPPGAHPDRGIGELLQSAFAFLLPPPLVPRDFHIVSAASVGAARSGGPTIAVGRRGQRVIRSGAPSRLQTTYDFRLFPATLGARALLPAQPLPQELHSMIKVRAQSRSLRGKLRQLAVSRAPGNVVRSLSAPIQVRVPEASELISFINSTIDDAHLGVFMGNRTNHDRPAVHVFSEDGDLAVIGKWSIEDKARHRQLRENDILVALKRIDSLAGTTPTVLAHLKGHLGDALVTDAFVGKPAPRHLAPPLLEWLRKCHIGGEIMTCKASVIVELIQELDGLKQHETILATAVARAIPHLADHQVPLTVVHGDFVPWNVVLNNGYASVFDWEYGHIEGIPDWDRSFFPLQIGLLTDRWDAPTLIRHVSLMAKSGSEFYPDLKFRALLVLVMVQIALRQVRDRERQAVVELALEGLLADKWLPTSDY
jgi:Phosphotransferase enzyme family